MLKNFTSDTVVLMIPILEVVRQLPVYIPARKKTGGLRQRISDYFEYFIIS